MYCNPEQQKEHAELVLRLTNMPTEALIRYAQLHVSLDSAEIIIALVDRLKSTTFRD